VECVRGMGLPLAVLINRYGTGSAEVDEYCHAEGIPIAATIQDDMRIAEAYARGSGLLEAAPEYRSVMRGLLAGLRSLAGGAA